MRTTTYNIRLLNSSDVEILSISAAPVTGSYQILANLGTYAKEDLTRIRAFRYVLNEARTDYVNEGLIFDSEQTSDLIAATELFTNFLNDSDRAVIDQLRSLNYVDLSRMINKDKQFRDVHVLLHR